MSDSDDPDAATTPTTPGAKRITPEDVARRLSVQLGAARKRRRAESAESAVLRNRLMRS